MTINLDLTAVGAWELTYYHKLVGNLQNRRIRAPLIDPVELPYLTDKHIFLVGASWLAAKPSWVRVGYFYQQISSIHIDDTIVFHGLGQVPSTEVDGTRHLIKLNAIQLVIFPKLTSDYRLRFEAMPWIEQLTLGVWEYRGMEVDTTEDLINAMRAKLETIEFKINKL